MPKARTIAKLLEMYDSLEAGIQEGFSEQESLRRLLYPAWKQGVQENGKFMYRAAAILPDGKIIVVRFEYRTCTNEEGVWVAEDVWMLDCYDGPEDELFINKFAGKSWTGSDVEKLAWESRWPKLLAVNPKTAPILIKHMLSVDYTSSLSARQRIVLRSIRDCILPLLSCRPYGKFRVFLGDRVATVDGREFTLGDKYATRHISTETLTDPSKYDNRSLKMQIRQIRDRNAKK